MRGVKKNLIKKPVYRIIDSARDLIRAATLIKSEKVIAVDLESDSMYHFKEKVCLIQIATARENLLIDPLAIGDMSPFIPVFSNKKIKKIFHGADYDVRSLYRDFNIEIHNLFDTQIASLFLGVKEISLNALVKNRFNIELDKKYQKKDWSKRPLPAEMMDYAVRDVLYLIPLTKILEKELKKKKRLDWVKEECQALSLVRPAASHTKPLCISFKGAGQLDPRSLGVLEAILQFREKIAEKKDQPLFRIFSNEAVLKMVKGKPVSLPVLKKCDALSHKQIDMYGNLLVDTIKRALNKKSSQLPVYPRKKRPQLSQAVLERTRALKEWRDKKAGELRIDPAVFFNKSTLSAVAKKNPVFIKDLQAIKEVKSWQKEYFGRDILTALRD